MRMEDISELRASISGVNLDEEAVKLMGISGFLRSGKQSNFGDQHAAWSIDESVV